MEVVALVSGGKDSCFAMMRCFDYGHKVVALANLLPLDDAVDELDSYMFQTVGHEVIVSYAYCMGLPLFRRRIQGSSREQRLNYTVTSGDEVEDMFTLLHEVKRQIPSISAVSSGAIASDYQRLRVESVCSRLGLVSLAYLWKQDQHILLEEMLRRGIVAITVKVAAMGLNPAIHLGKELSELKSHLLDLNEMYGINVCGEGGEYETLTLDCPLFHNARIVLDELKIVPHSSDSIAPVGILHPSAFHLEDKATPSGSIHENVVNSSKCDKLVEVLGDIQHFQSDESQSFISGSVARSDPEADTFISRIGTNLFSICCWTQKQSEASSDLLEDLSAVLSRIELELNKEGLDWVNVLYIHLYISNMKKFALVNDVYMKFVTEKKCYLGVPSRSTIELPLLQSGMGNAYVEVLVADEPVKKVLHVQSISCWAPSCIGPYSQATLCNGVLHMAGQLGLDPPTMQLLSGGSLRELEQALHNSEAVAECFSISLYSSLLHLVVYVSAHVSSSERHLIEKKLQTKFSSSSQKRLCNPTFLYILAPDLPKGAQVEIKPALYVPEDPEPGSSEIADNEIRGQLDMLDSSCKVHLTGRKICSAVISVNPDLETKISTSTLDNSCCNPESQLRAIAAFFGVQVSKILASCSLAWDDIVMLRIYYTTKPSLTQGIVRTAFSEAFANISNMRNCQNSLWFIVVPVLGSACSASMDDAITCELFAVKKQ